MKTPDAEKLEGTKADSTEKMPTLAEMINKATAQGYTESFKVGEMGLTDDHESRHYSPAEIAIPNFQRFEGYSDPEDNAILYWIKTVDDRKGILIDAYGTYADEHLSKFIRSVEEIEKNKKPEGQ